MRFLSWNQINKVLLNISRESWTPTFSAASGSPGSITVNEATYLNLGNTVDFFIDFTVNSVGTANVDMRFTLPIQSTQLGIFNPQRDNQVSYQGMILLNSTTAVIWVYNNNSPWSTDRFTASGRYRIG